MPDLMEESLPEQLVEAGLQYLQTMHPDDDDMLFLLECVHEGLTQMRPNPAQYIKYPEILEPAIEIAAQRVQVERDRRAGRIH